LGTAIDVFRRAVVSRADEDTADRTSQLRDAIEGLRHQTITYVGAARDVTDRRTLRKLTAQISEQQESADNLVRIADARRDLLRETNQYFDSLDARSKASLDGAWKILGRVVARQSLIDLSRRIDDIRRNLGSLSEASVGNQAGIAALTAAETAFD